MTIKTFDANRVGGGTFQLEQDPLTGEFKVKEVGFVKLPELKLPEIDQAAPVVPDPTPDDPTDDPADPGTGGGSSGGGGGSQQDFTGESMYKNIQKQATTFAGQDTGIVPTTSRDRTNINEGAIQVEGLKEKEAYDKAVANYNAIAERNRDLAMGKQTLSEEERLGNKADIDAARNEMDSARKNYEGTFETIKAAPEIADFSQGPRTVPTGTLTGAKVEDIGEPLRKSTFDADTFDDAVGTSVTAKKNILEVAKQKAKQIIDPSNLGAVKVAETAGKIITGILSGGREPTATQKLNTSLFKTRGDLGSNVDPGRIVGNPATDLYAGFNRTSAYGNLEKAGDKRLETRQKTIERKGYKPGDKFYDDTEKMKDQASKYKAAKQKATQGPAGSDGGGKTDSGKIVCTMMNESYGFGSFRNKIWLRHSKNLAPEYQIGYHRIFLPLVKKAKTNKVLKKILEHIAIHRTIDIRQEEKSKIHLLGRVYRKILEPICYWVGKI